MLSLITPAVIVEFPHKEAVEIQHPVSDVELLAKLVELYEISNHIMISQEARSSLAERLCLPRLSTSDTFGTAIQFETCLNDWEKSLPQSLKLDNFQEKRMDVSYRRAIMVQLRYVKSDPFNKPNFDKAFLTNWEVLGFCIPESSSLGQCLGDSVYHSLKQERIPLPSKV